MAISSPRDGNRKPALMGTLYTDGTPINIKINSSTGAVEYSDGVSVVLYPNFVNAERDNNRVSVLVGQSSADPTVWLPVLCDANGKILIKST